MEILTLVAVAVCLLGESFAFPTPVLIVHPGTADDIILNANNTVNATTPAPTNSSLPKRQIIVSPGTAQDIVITANNTLNATTSAPSDTASASDLSPRSSGRLPLALTNNFNGAINAYITGLDESGRLVMLQPDGAFYYPSCDSSATVPQIISADVAIALGSKGNTLDITIPGYISSARIWFAAGELKFYCVWNPATKAPSLVEPSAVNPSDPSAGVNWGFVELSYVPDGGLYANISYVDFVGLILGMSLSTTDGSAIQSAAGLSADALKSICAALQSQGQSDGQPWGNLCMSDSKGNLLRALAPTDYLSNDNSAFESYWNSYIDTVWVHYSSNTLSINTQNTAGIVACTVKDDLLQCEGDNRGYAKPSAGDIFGCNSGPFALQSGDNGVHQAVVPRLCAAFHRSTLLMDGGNTQPGLSSTNYYHGAPTNWYSKFVHQYEVDGRGYAFSYDDVNPDGENQSGVVSSGNPGTLSVIVGGPI